MDYGLCFFSFLGLTVYEIYYVYLIYFISHSLWSLMVFQLYFKDPFHNIRMCLQIASVVCDLYDLFLNSDYFSALKGEAFLSKFLGQKKSLFSRSLNVILVL